MNSEDENQEEGEQGEDNSKDDESGDESEEQEDGSEEESDTTAVDSIDKRKRKLIRAYDEKIIEVAREETMLSIKRTMELYQVLKKVKFVKQGEELGSFNRPDFTNEKSWQSIVWNGMAFKTLSDGKKAMKWMTYLPQMKKLFSDYKTSVTSNQKEAFLKCEYVNENFNTNECCL